MILKLETEISFYHFIIFIGFYPQGLLKEVESYSNEHITTTFHMAFWKGTMDIQWTASSIPSIGSCQY